ncbi:hypothetical protein COE84_26760 [Bacillus wiedmannii]|uniref:hypothetical protein n=1 Tax=Bacillus wiedmannii TaxID=1890302 RepID=UPI000BFD0E7E|nr:hypothetical protein [Bacillus wiedmannii]PHA27754.1 hypothetical protein COE59_06315 [Bacillus wiedmannii]PHB07999.1 hypothetical protein COE84_26760 [Bacillus wiedmannii]
MPQQPIQIYLGSPKTTIMQVYKVPSMPQPRLATVTQIIFTNTEETEAKVTVTINTIDIIKDYIVKAGDTTIIPMSLLKDDDSISLQQEKKNAINVTISGVLE